MAKLISQAPATPVAIEKELRIAGLKNPQYLVIIGFSTRKVLEVAKAQPKEISNVLIIEPNISVFKNMLQYEWIGDLVTDPDMDIIVGIPPSELLPHILKAFSTSTEKTGNRISRALQPEIIADPFIYPQSKDGEHPLVKEVSKIVSDAAKQLQLSMGCSSDSFFRFEQMATNIDKLPSLYRIAAQFGKFKDIPAIVIGAGPSLPEFIEAYHKYNLKDKALLISVDASLKKLLESGIKPHIVARCERKNTLIFNGVTKEDTRGIFYAAYPWCDREYFDLFDESFMLFRTNGVCKWMEPYNFGDVNGGVSSGNAALELAFLLGCPKAFLTGIDLCFLDNRSHSEGTMVEFDPNKSKDSWVKVAANDGGEVTTIPVWLRCLHEFQSSIAKYGDKIKVISTSTRGAAIPGAQFIPWDKIAEELLEPTKKPMEILRQNLDRHPPKYAEELEKKRQDTIKFMKEASLELTGLFKTLEDQMHTGRGEEEKITGQLKAYFNANDYFTNITQVRKQLMKLYGAPATTIDSFRKKYYLNPLFQGILDMCQIDLMTCEQKCSALKNLIEIEHERVRYYIGYQAGLLHTLKYYIDKIPPLLEQGPEIREDYTKVKEL